MSKTRGTDKRQRHAIIQARLNPDEQARVMAKAEAAGISVSELIRCAVLGYRAPRSKTDLEFARQLLADIGKIGSNLNQLTHYANLGRTLEASLAETLRDVREIRNACVQSLGLERNRKQKQD